VGKAASSLNGTHEHAAYRHVYSLIDLQIDDLFSVQVAETSRIPVDVTTLTGGPTLLISEAMLLEIPK
jgi:hypothetical protein